ncbi:bola protein [Polychytrium aggregatum]|uniref:bola protein n=1 Tax=Polychytrium aggregatum TaxID=110093 RepID=UPI0022FEC4D0|nr:bola protein [Polychytrium aggregatum]KAI9206225.1 bola protein [Polychytrium aggregatum]
MRLRLGFRLMRAFTAVMLPLLRRLASPGRSYTTKSSLFLHNFMNTTTGGPVYTQIHQKLNDHLRPSHLEIVDDSSKHAGHAAMKGLKPNETHFRVLVASDEFKGKTLLQRHKLVYQILDDELKAGVHALQITAKTPDEFERANSLPAA